MSSQFSKYFAISARDKAWGLYVTSVGHAELSSGCEYPPSVHPAGYFFQWDRGRVLDQFVLLHIKAGGGIFSSREVPEQAIKAGDVLLIPPGEWHRYRPDAATGWEEFWITFEGSVADSWLAEGFFSRREPVIATGLQFELAETFDRMIELGKRHLHAPYLMAGLCHSIVGTALSTTSRETMSSSDRQLLAAAEYLRNHLKTSNLQTLAKTHGMGLSTFRRRFHEYFECSPKSYLATQRIASAKRYLKETDLPLKLVADRLGYSTEFYFMRVFKQHTGVTPTEWRNGF